MNYCNKNDNPFFIYYGLPNAWNNILNYPLASVGQHQSDGFYELITPAYDAATQYLGSIIFNVNQFTYTVLNYTTEQIQEKALAANEQAQNEILDRNAKTSALKTYQEQAQYYSNDDALDNQSLYPLWMAGSPMLLNEKVQSFNAQNELLLYKCIQAHTTQEGWQPATTPALFTQVAYDGQILPWVQPTGANDAYPIGGKVTHNGFTWESTINANTTEPMVTVFNWWIKL